MLSTLSILGLALLDSLSIGTFVIPLMLVLNQGGVKVRPLTLYFFTVCVSYFLIGATLLLGITRLQDALTGVLSSDPIMWFQLVIGILLLLYGVFAPDPKKAEGSEVRQPRNLTDTAVIGLALTAVVLEAATMVPYLAAIAILSDAAIGMTVRLGVLALYCLVMTLPALICIGLLSIFGERIWARVERFANRAERETKITLMWIAALIGIYLIGNAAQQLGWI